MNRKPQHVLADASFSPDASSIHTKGTAWTAAEVVDARPRVRGVGMDAHEFVQENIDSVPHLEALILFWNSRPVGWTCEEMASRLYIPFERVNALLRDLVRLQLVAESGTTPTKFSYYSRSKEQDEMMHLVDEAYRRDLVRISTMLHEKASPAVRDFARAFRFKKEQD